MGGVSDQKIWSAFSMHQSLPAYTSGGRASSRYSPHKTTDDFDVRGVAKLIDRRDRRQPIAAAFKDLGVPRKCRVIAGDRYNTRDRASRQLTRLLLGTLPRRIKNNGV